MRLFLLTLLTMIAFAANSVLNRMALTGGAMDAELFGALRLAAGAAVLVSLLRFKGQRLVLGGWSRIWPVLALLTYIFGFSAAYMALNAGVGALILFAVVQVTMFAGALVARETVPVLRWAGAVLALLGLAYLLWPDGEIIWSKAHIAVMMAAGVGWGIYSLLGRDAEDPLQATAVNFLLAAGIASVGIFLFGVSGPWTKDGILLALVSGGLTSGLAYALWYQLLPQLGAARGAVAQLSVPVFALIGGAILFGEAITWRFAIASMLVMVGVLISLRRG